MSTWCPVETVVFTVFSALYYSVLLIASEVRLGLLIHGLWWLNVASQINRPEVEEFHVSTLLNIQNQSKIFR